MVFSDLFGAIRRRWYVVVVGLVATMGLGYLAAATSPPTYTARGLVLLVPSKAAVGHGGNPLLVMDGLTLPASILVAYYQGAAAQTEAADVVPDATYEVSIDESTRGPVIAIDVADPTASGAIKALDYLAQSIPDNLSRLQTDVDAPSESVVSAMPLTMDTEATADTSAATRMRIAALGIGLVATLLLTSALDGLLVRRRRNRSGVTESGERRLRAADAPERDTEPERPEVRRKAR
jgi:hypothetical protein